MTNMYSWKKYNLNIQKLIKKNILHNLTNKFNANESFYYPQTRDIFALIANSPNIKNILDFGSNLSLISNLTNRINVKDKKFYIYDPFFTKNKELKIKNVNYKICSNFNEIVQIKFDLIHFGSCIQYIDNFYDYLNLLSYSKKSKILFTATPMNYNDKYLTKQTNNKNLFQIVHNYKNLCMFLKSKKFNLSFKSSMNVKLAALKTVNANTFFLNLLFEHE